MSLKSNKFFSSAVMAVVLAASGAVIATPLVSSAAYAQGNSGGKGNSDERGRGNDGESRSNGRSEASAPAEARGRGALASELKGLNAANASPEAFANASPDSMPGRLAAFKNEYEAVYDATVELNDATEALADYTDFSSDFEVGTEEYNDELTILQKVKSDAETALIDVNTEYQASYLALTDGVELSAEAQDELLRLLGLQ
jgi:hypothetical protein